MEKAACRSCHNPDGVASATRLHFPGPRLAAGEDRGIRTIAGDADRPRAAGQSLLLNKPTNRIPHAGGERIKPGTQDEVTLKAWIQSADAAFRRRAWRSALKFREEEAAGAGQARPQTGPAAADAQPVQPHGSRSAGRPDRARRTSFRPRTSSTASATNRRRRAFRRC